MLTAVRLEWTGLYVWVCVIALKMWGPYSNGTTVRRTVGVGRCWLSCSAGLAARTFVTNKLISYARPPVRAESIGMQTEVYARVMGDQQIECGGGKKIPDDCCVCLVLTVHVTLMFVLDERVAARFVRVRIVDDDDLLDRAVRLELAAQLRLGCVVVLDGRRMTSSNVGTITHHPNEWP